MTPPTPTPPNANLEPIPALLARIGLAAQQSHAALTLWPLVLREDAPRRDEPAYVLLSRAPEDGTLQIDEISESGSLPRELGREVRWR
jgi:hypothetical protein